MLLQTADFNRAEALINTTFLEEWQALQGVLEKMPLHLKASDQDGIQGTLIFDPVGTNEYIKAGLRMLSGWFDNVPIPVEYAFLGTNVDFCHGAVLVEIQFSNYPFLLNNAVRSELFYKAKLPLAGRPIELVVIVTKARMFPASNSTLYYEQARKQISELVKNQVFDIPIRLVGIFSPPEGIVPVQFTKYSNKRYSRTVIKRDEMQCEILPGKHGHSRCDLRLVTKI